ncbi:MAG: 50S ribosomal protein L29 [bacterium]|nr:50S ribosomal protein L29 [bacterium]MDE0501262.1 50S ribosomal protein L29 [bacterium]
MSPAELREMNYRELTEKLAESKEELFNLRFQLATNQLDNTARIGAVKKTVARIRTILRQREIELWYAQQEAAANE